MASFLLFFTRTLAKLPLPLLRAMASLLGALLYFALPSLRRTVADHLAQAQLKLNVCAVIQANVRGLADMVWVWFNSQAKVAAHCVVRDASELDAARNQAAGLIVLTPHLGCFEVLGKWWAHDAPLTAMYRRPDKAWLTTFIETARQTPQLHMAPADAGGVRKLLKTLKNSQAVCILPDQSPRVGEGIWVPWFGRLAYTITLPAKLHLATGAPMCVCAALPTRTGWEICYQAFGTSAQEDSVNVDAEMLTRSLNAALERMVLQAPQHYAWSYRRYKGVPPVQKNGA